MHVSLFGLAIALGAVALVVTILIALLVRRKLKRDAARAGLDSVSAYLKSAPRTDREKRDAIDLAMKGLVICLIGLLVPPFLILGIFPLFFGLRKVAYASLGLGLVDDAEEDLPVA